MTGVDIAAHASEAGGASPLRTGSAETRDHSSPAAASPFSEALAAQSDEERPVLVGGFPPDHSQFAVGDSGGEPSESESELTTNTEVIPELTEATGVTPEADVSPTLHDGVTHALLTALVGDNLTTVGETGEVLPNSAVRAVTPAATTPTVVEGIDAGGVSSQTHVALNRVSTPIESFDPTDSPASLQPKTVNVAAAAPVTREGTATAPRTSSQTAVLPISADPTSAPTPGIHGSGSLPEVVTLAVPDGGVDQLPVPAMPGAKRLAQSTETLAKTPTNVSSDDPDVGRVTPATTPSTGETPVHAVTVGPAQDTPEVEGAFPKNGVAEPTTPARSGVVAAPPTLAEPRMSDGPSRMGQAAERVIPGDGQSATSPAPAAAVELDADTLDTVLDEKTTAGRFLGRSEVPVKGKTQQSVPVVGIRQTTPIMVDLPSGDSTATHRVLSLPGLLGTDAAVAQQVSVSIGMGPADAWRYEEVARLLEDSGHVSQQTRASAAASAVMPLEAVSDWSGAAVRSSFAPPVLSNPEQLELPDQLVRAIRMQWRNGVGDAKLRLTPENLGEVLVSLQVRQGAVSAVLRADSEIVRDWIRSHQHELKALLEAQGLQLDEFVVEEDGHADKQSGREFDHPRRRPSRQTSEARFEVRV